MHTLKKFIHYYQPYKLVFFIDLICAAIISLVDLSYPQILRTMTKTLFTRDTAVILHALPWIASGLLLMYLIQSLCKYYVSYQGHMMGANMERDMRQQLFDHYEELSFSYYSQNNSGQMMSKLVSDLFDISEFAHHGPENLFISLVKIVGSFIFLFLINKKLALPLIVLVILMFLFSFRQNQKMQRTFMDKLKEALNTVHGGFAYLLMTEDAMIGALDPNGFRPLSLGKMKNGAYVLASETCALDVVGAELVRNIRPGEIVVVRLDVPHVVPIAGRADFLFLQKLEPRDRVGLSGSERGFLSFQCPDSRPESIHRGSQRLFFRREGFKPPGERGFTVFERRFFGFKARKLILKRLLRLTESGLLLGGRRKSCFRFRFRLPDPVPLRFQAFELLHHGFLDFEELEHGVGPLSING